jgi:hypothetical protein
MTVSVRELTKHDEPWEKAVAICERLVPFDDKDEALNWLVKQATARR